MEFQKLDHQPSMSYSRGPITNIKLDDTISISQLIDMIQSQEIKQKNDYVLQSSNGREKDCRKKQMPYFIPSGIFSHRKKESLVQRSCYIGLDIDKVESVEELKKQLSDDNYVHLCFKSVSQNGLRVIVKIEMDHGEHINYFEALSQYFKSEHDVEIDKSCKDISRAFFLSYDSEPFFNSNSDICDASFIERHQPSKKKPRGSKTDLKNHKIKALNVSPVNLKMYGDIKLKWAKNRIENCVDGEKHDTLLRCSTALGTYVHYGVISHEEAVKTLQTAIETRRETVRDINLAFKTIDNGLSFGMSKPYDITTEIVTKETRFWDLIPKNGGLDIRISFVRVFQMLQDAGFHIMKRGKGIILVQVQDNVVREVEDTAFIQHLKIAIDRLPFNIGDGFNKLQLKEKIHNKLPSLFTERQLKMCDLFEPQLKRDTKNASFFYYQNGFVEVTKDDIELKPYSELQGHIWKDQIRDREFDIDAKSTDCEFERFLFNVGYSGESEPPIPVQSEPCNDTSFLMRFLAASTG